MVDEVTEHVEHLRLDMLDSTVAADLTASEVDLPAFEFSNHRHSRPLTVAERTRLVRWHAPPAASDLHKFFMASVPNPCDMDNSSEMKGPHMPRTGSTRRGAIALVLALGVSAAVVSPVIEALGKHYNHGPDIEGTISDWMKWVPSEVRLSQLSLPGTHDTLSFYGGDIAVTQSLSIAEQLESGVRVLDIRTRIVLQDGETGSTTDGSVWDLRVYHGIIDQRAELEVDVCKPVRDFLLAHPTETVLMRLGTAGVPEPSPSKYTDADGDEQEIDNTGGSYDPIVRDYLTRGACGDVIMEWAPKDNNGMSLRGAALDNYIPSLGETRGKLVIIENWANISPTGMNWPNKDDAEQGKRIQDWSVPVTTDVDTKFDKIKKHFDDLEGASSTNLWINHLSGSSGGIYPYSLANGLGFDKGMNERTLDLLFTGSYQRTGIVMMDFPGIGLIAAIVAHNLKLVKDQSLIGDDWQNLINHTIHSSTRGSSFNPGRDQMATFLRSMLPQRAVHVLVLEPHGWAVSTNDVDGATASYKFGDRTYLIIRTATGFKPMADTDSKAFRDPISALIVNLDDSANAGARRTAVRDYLLSNHPADVWNVAVRPLSDKWSFSPFGGGWSFDFDGYRHYMWGTKSDVAPVIRPSGDLTQEEGLPALVDLSGSYDPRGLDLSYRWDIGADGSWEQDLMTAATALTVTSDDNRTIPVRVQASNGSQTTTTTFDVVFTNVAPTFSPAITQDSRDEGRPITVSGVFFDQATADSHTVSVSWGDGTASIVDVAVPSGVPTTRREFSATHTYPNDGQFDALIEVTDDDGGPNGYIRRAVPIFVDNVAPTLFIAPPSSPPGPPYTLNHFGFVVDPGADDITLAIDWDDGTDIEQMSSRQVLGGQFVLTHEFSNVPASGAIYDVSVVASDGTDSDQSEFAVVIGDAGNIRPTITHDCPSVLNVRTIDCTGTIVDADSASWPVRAYRIIDPDGTPGPWKETVLGDDLTFPIAAELGRNGMHTINFDLVDDTGLSIYTSERSVRIAVRAPVVTIEMSARRAEFPIEFYLTIDDPLDSGNPVFLEYGDGTRERLDIVSEGGLEDVRLFHTYADPGLYIVRAWRLDEGSNFGFDETVELEIGPSGPDFDIGPDEELDRTFRLQRTFPITFHGSAGQVVVDWGDGRGSFLSRPTYELDHTYENNGLYTVEVWANDAAGSTTRSFELTIDVQNTTPTLNAGADETTTAEFFHRDFTVVDPDADRWIIDVDWGDGSTNEQIVTDETEFGITHRYTEAGEYVVIVTVDDGLAEANDSFTVTYHPPPNVDVVGPHFVSETESVTVSGSVDSVDLADVTWALTPNNESAAATSCSIENESALTTNITCQDEGEWILTLHADDGIATGSASTLFTVANEAPTIDRLSVIDHRGAAIDAGGAVLAGRTTSIEVDLSDAGDDLLTVDVTLEGVVSTYGLPLDERSLSIEHTFSELGLSAINVRVADDDGAEARASLDLEVINESIAIDRVFGNRLREIVGDAFESRRLKEAATLALKDFEAATLAIAAETWGVAVGKWSHAYQRLELAGIDIDAALLLEFAEHFYTLERAEWEGSTWSELVRFEIAEEFARRATDRGAEDPPRTLMYWSKAIALVAL